MGLEPVIKPTSPQAFQFEIGHDYEITWMIVGLQRYPRISRMGYIGPGMDESRQVMFDARGPDRKTGGEFAGTQQLDRRWLIEVREVPRVLAMRYAVRRA